MFDLKNYIQIPHKLSCVCVCLSFIHALPTRVERPRSTQTLGPKRSAAIFLSLPFAIWLSLVLAGLAVSDCGLSLLQACVSVLLGDQFSLGEIWV